jgi:hypothetical protein
MEIEISFGLWKRLAASLRDENDSYDALISRLLDRNTSSDQTSVQPPSSESIPVHDPKEGAFFKDVFLPNGTELRATYKGKTYFARISGSEWIDQTTGERRSSPSQAAYFITDNNVNGWLFWLAKRPGDGGWHSLNALRAGYL